jgi:hypothetical protein
MTTNRHAPDVAVAVELFERVDISHWPALTAGMLHPTPFIAADDLSRIGDWQSWLASHAADESSFVQAAVANFSRVLRDLNLVLNHNMEVRGQQFWVFKWYRLFHGAPSHAREVERFEAHIALIHNLAVELTRALNLVAARARAADESVLGGVGLAVAPLGPDHNLMQPPFYSTDQARLPQPYPGLEAFPSVLSGRDGSFRVGQTDEVATEADLQEWIAYLESEHGPGAEPPGSEIPPVSLPQPTGVGRRIGLPSRVQAGVAVLAVVAAVVTIATAPAWASGGAIGAFVSVWVLHRYVWQWTPSLWAVVAVVATIAAGSAIGASLGSPSRAVNASPPVNPVGCPTTIRDGKPGAAILVAEGQIVGDAIFAGRSGHGGGANTVTAAIGSETTLALFIYNFGPSFLSNVMIRVMLPKRPATYATLEAVI